MDIEREFARFARSQRGVSSMALTDYTTSVRSAYINPQIIEERQLNAVAMDVFSRLMMDRIIILGVPIDDDVANIIMAQLLFLESVDASKDIQMYINSPGGGVYAGLAIYDTMQLLHADVATICTGMAASMAAVLMAAGTKGKRSAPPHSRMMIHQPLGGAEGPASDVEIRTREMLRIKKELQEILALHTGQPYERIEKDCDRDYYLTAVQAKEYGLVDSVLEHNERKREANR